MSSFIIQQRMVAVIYKNSFSHRLTEDIHLMIEYNNRIVFSHGNAQQMISVFSGSEEFLQLLLSRS